MLSSLRKLLPLLALVLLVSGAKAAGELLAGEVRDDAGFFSADAVTKANDLIRDIHDKYGKDLLIETFKSVPDDQTEAFKKVEKDREATNQLFSKWVVKRAEERRVNGVYVLICKHPGHVEIYVDGRTKQKAFTVENRKRLERIVLDKFAEGTKAEKQKEGSGQKAFDQGLIEACEYVRDTFKANGVTRGAALPPANQPIGDRRARHPEPAGINWMGLVCPIVAVVLVVWLVIGLIRAFTNRASGPGYGGGAPGYGPGPGYAPGYGGGGGGGGGFMSGLIGGMFGAAAGSWMYDRFFRGDTGAYTGGGWNTPPSYGPGPDTTGSTGGGDFGGDAGTPDVGGGSFDGGDTGGGDFGGGDTGGGDFGGGDFGGGGGDTGGGDF